MEIKTKYEIGDTVFVIFNNKVRTVEILGVNILIGIDNFKANVTIKYKMTSDGNNVFNEDQCFKTKQDLVGSL